eukprot:scaffold30926_cov62-Phaeocystis_antarctica.AAC.13
MARMSDVQSSEMPAGLEAGSASERESICVTAAASAVSGGHKRLSYPISCLRIKAAASVNKSRSAHRTRGQLLPPPRVAGGLLAHRAQEEAAPPLAHAQVGDGGVEAAQLRLVLRLLLPVAVVLEEEGGRRAPAEGEHLRHGRGRSADSTHTRQAN